MTIPLIFYILFIWPVSAVIEFFFTAFQELFHGNIGMVIIFLSITVNAMLLPVYTAADRWQDEERDIRKRMKRKCEKIKAVFRGDERQMLLNAYYRQMGYSPVKALKSSAGLLIQIPFFFAAYQFLSHSHALQGSSFLVISNLGQEDGLIKIGVLGINLLPVLMTAVNLLSASVYAKNLEPREKVQLIIIALVFLVLLYRSPAGLVLYWTVNNLFSLGKNLAVKKCREPKKVLFVLAFITISAVIVVLVSGRTGINRYRNILIVLCLVLLVLLVTGKYIIRFAKSLFSLPPHTENQRLFFASVVLMAAVLGVLVPAQVIASSPAEFPGFLAIAGRTFLQSAAFCLLIPLLLWAFANPGVRTVLAFCSAALSLTGITSYFIFSSAYGTMTRSFRFENSHRLLDAFPPAVSLLIVAGGILISGAAILFRKQRMLGSLFHAAAVVVLVLGGISFVSIHTELQNRTASNATEKNSGPEGFLKFTSAGKNTVLFFIDRAVGVTLYKALEFMPALKSDLDGFVWYPNTLSFANFTVSGLPAVFGGYEYSPGEIALREGQTLEEKINESFAVLPKIFGESGRRVLIIDPPIANSSTVPATVFFNRMENVESKKIEDYFLHRYTEEFPQKDEKITDSFDFDILFRYGIFRIVPPAFRYTVYYMGQWWRSGRSGNYEKSLSSFSPLYYLRDLCGIDDGPDTLNIFMNETTHEDTAFTAALHPVRGALQYSAEERSLFGSEETISYSYAYIAALSSIAQWLSWLKDREVYDNTRIIIVSDHGREYANSLFEDKGMERFNPLLLVKERNSRGELHISPELMTNADAPVLALKDFAAPVNPFLNTPINADMKRGILTVSEIPGNLKDNLHSSFRIHRSRFLHGNNIFLNASWDPWQTGH